MTKREHMAHLAGVSPATISNWKKTNPKIYKIMEFIYQINNNIDEKIKEFNNKDITGQYQLLIDIAKLEIENEAILDKKQQNRRKQLINIRNKIYGVKK